MIPLDEARRVVLEGCTPLAPRVVPLAEALGCVLTAPVVARVDVPPFANSAMDGYALRSVDVAEAPVALEVVGRVLAGGTLGTSVGAGQAARIMTGAPVPSGADAVCMVERTRASGDDSGTGTVLVEVSVAPGENVRSPGGDVRAGEEVLPAGAEVGATQLAALISAGCTEVAAVPAPRVGVISTGDELVDPGLPLGVAQIFDSNRPMLLALVAEAGCVPVDLGRSSDDEDQLTGRIESALRDVDAVVLSGGVSVGDVDVVRAVLDRLGGGAGRWMQIAIRPAKPFSFTPLPGPRGPVPAFGLPGNPVSSAVGFELLVRPALRAIGGHRVTERPRCRARAQEPFMRQPDGKLHLVRVQLAPDPSAGAPLVEVTLGGAVVSDSVSDPAPPPTWLARPCPGQGSHQIRSMAIADGLALLPDGNGVGAGEVLEVIVTNAALGAGLLATR